VIAKKPNPLEETVEQFLLTNVEAAGGMCIKFKDPARRGAPDRLVLMPGRPALFVELKRPRNGRLAAHQVRYHRDLRAIGQRVWVLWSKEDVRGFFAEI
jgi:hypothetical protein